METVPTRADIETTIADLRAKVERMPAHWVERRAALMDEVDALVQDWLDSDG